MKRLLLALLLLAGAARAEALDYTGLWFNPAQPGYGFNLAQSDGYIFATFFIYGPNGTPTWYTAGLDADGNGHYAGVLNSTVGTYFALPWVPGNFGGGPVGTATLTPSTANAYQATLAITLTGQAPVVIPIERQTLKVIALGGAYAGGQSGAYSGCTVATDNYAYVDHYNLQVTHSPNGQAEFLFRSNGGLVCTLAGPLEQHGPLYRIGSASYVCSDGVNTTAVMSEIRATSLGIEGRYRAAGVGGGCAEDATFSAVLN